MKLVQIAIAALLLAVTAGDAAAQQKTLKDRILGTWHFVIAEVTAPTDRNRFRLFGNRGHSDVHAGGRLRADPHRRRGAEDRIGNRLAATPEDYAAIMRGTIAQLAPTPWTRTSRPSP